MPNLLYAVWDEHGGNSHLGMQATNFEAASPEEAAIEANKAFSAANGWDPKTHVHSIVISPGRVWKVWRSERRDSGNLSASIEWGVTVALID